MGWNEYCLKGLMPSSAKQPLQLTPHQTVSSTIGEETDLVNRTGQRRFNLKGNLSTMAKTALNVMGPCLMGFPPPFSLQKEDFQPSISERETPSLPSFRPHTMLYRLRSPGNHKSQVTFLYDGITRKSKSRLVLQ